VYCGNTERERDRDRERESETISQFITKMAKNMAANFLSIQ
jgi:hypothetical protein